MLTVKLDFSKFDPAVIDLLQRQAPARANKAVTAAARAIARELRAASPRGGPPNRTRAKDRAAKPGTYGPLARGWRVSAAQANARSFRFSSSTRYQLPPMSAAVFVKTFYARFVEFGTNPGSYRIRNTVGKVLSSYRVHPRAHPAHPFAGPVEARAAQIAEGAIEKALA